METKQNEALVVVANGSLAKTKEKGINYLVTSPLTGNSIEMTRDVDFGVIPKTKKPSLYKSGAEKIAMAYGLMTRYSIESKQEEYDQKSGSGFYFYLVKCSLYKTAMVNNQLECVEYANGYGSSNTLESRNGFNSAFNAANSTLKMAQKRALVQAVLAVSGLSSMFSQDMEDETGANAQTLVDQTPTSKINKNQRNRLFALAAQAGMTTEQAKQWFAAEGYSKTSDMTVEQFEAVCVKLKELNKVN